MIEVSRTLMKSEPELAELVVELDGLEVTMAEKGFGTQGRDPCSGRRRPQRG